MMDNEKLDGLLVDHALGASSDDVGMLIEAFAARDGEIRGRLAEYRNIADLARRSGRSETAVPAFPRQRLAAARQARVVRGYLKWAAAAAACIAIGFCAGTLRHARQPQAAISVASVSPALVAEPAAATNTEFWSLSRLQSYELQAADRAAPGEPIGAYWINQRIGG